MGDRTLFEFLQLAMIVFFLAIPPWLAFTKYIKGKVHRGLIVLTFAMYLVLTVMTQQIFPFLAVLLVFWFVSKSEPDAEERWNMRPLKGKRLEVAVIAVGFKFFITIVNLWFVLFMKGFGVTMEQQKITEVFLDADWSKIGFLVLLTVVTAPILEEFVFRHIFYRQLSKRIGKIGGCLISSLLFALLHFNFLGTISFLGVAVFNCYLYDKYGYRAAVVNHFVFNSVSTILMVAMKLFNLG